MSTNNGTSETWSPPYASFTTLMNTINRMKEEGGAPSRIDRSYLSNMPGSVRPTFLGTLRTLDLITDDSAPTDRLNALVEAEEGDEKQGLVATLIADFYSPVLALPRRATQSQLEEVFRSYGVTGSTLRKAVAFFLAAAKYAGTPLSPHFKVPKDPTTGEGRPRAARQPRSKTDSGTSVVAASHPGSGNVMDAPTQHPLIAGLISELPPPGSTFPPDKQEAWFTIAKAAFQLLYNSGTRSAASGAGDA